MFPTLKLAPRWSDSAELLEVSSNGKTDRVRRSDGPIETVNGARLLPVTGHAWERETPQDEEELTSDSDSCYIERDEVQDKLILQQPR